MSNTTNVQSRIEAILADHPVVLFMKGSPEMPQCGFSAASSAALVDLTRFHSVDVLADQEIREGIKVFGNWPTIPQLYVRGELVGGADIIGQMASSGELHDLLGVPQPDRTPPEITVTDAAVKAIREHLPDPAEAVLHLAIDARNQAEFRLAPAGEQDVVTEANGLEIHFDPGSAQRARGVVIDWTETVAGAGLSLSFPGSATIQSLTVEELSARLDRGDITLVDVRPAADRARAPMPSATAYEEARKELAALPKDTPLAFLCHHGNSSRTVAEQFAGHGFTAVHNVEGGIDAWSTRVDASVPRY